MYTYNKRQIGRQLQKARIRKSQKMGRRCTQKDVCKVVGITSSFYSQMENGQAIPHLEILVNIANFFEISFDYLLSEDDI